MKNILFIIIIFQLPGFITEMNAQSFADRFTLQIGTSVNSTDNYEPGALSLAFHPDFKINKSFSISVRYDVNILQFGSRGNKFSGINRFYQRESYVRGISSLSLFPTFNTYISGAATSFGIGGGYIQRSAILEKTYNFDTGKLFNTSYIPATNSFYWSIIASASFDKINAGVIYSKIKNLEILRSSFTYASIFVNYNLLSEYGYSKKTKLKRPSDKIPLIMLEAGIQPFGSLRKYGSGINAFIEPKIRVADNISVGFRINTKNPAPIGFDKNPVPYVAIEEGPSSRNYTWRNTRIMEDIYARLLTAQYYLPKINNGWYFFNIGLGRYNRKASEELEVYDYDLQPFTFPAFPHTQNWGGLIGVGAKTGIFRLSLDYNFSGKNIPDYMALQLGLDFNFYKN